MKIRLSHSHPTFSGLVRMDFDSSCADESENPNLTLTFTLLSVLMRYGVRDRDIRSWNTGGNIKTGINSNIFHRNLFTKLIRYSRNLMS